ncbi:GGDEF domain-containing protein [Algiphilus sp.]|uniref:GGDEF domain-containing protein n=1 Tax=Algiphilus sp. TaxID=1872431 RepID=UPI0032EDF55A
MQRAVRSATCRPLDRRPCPPRWRYQARPDTAPASGSCARPPSDFDGFKAVNDTHGHEAGDLVLTQVAQRFQQSFDQQEGLKATQTLIDVIRQPVVTVYGSCQVGASIGVALAPHQPKVPDELVKLADAAMYRAKRGARSRRCWWKRVRWRSLQPKG